MGTLNEKDFNLIEKYISGVLTSEELEDFKKRLENDSEFAKNFNYRTKLADNWFKADEYRMTKEQVKDLFQKEKKSKRKKVSFFYAAASIALLFGLSVIYFQQSDQSFKNTSMAELKEDSPSTQNSSGLSFNEQPAMGNVYVNARKFINSDTLRVYGFESIETTQLLQIILLPNEELVKQVKISSFVDTLSIPLKSLPVGNYKWQIEGADLSGYFDIVNETN